MTAVPSRIVIVTGASSGLGRVMAEALLRDGHAVVGTARSEAMLDEVRTAVAAFAESRFVPVVADVRSAADCERAVAAAVERFGGCDALVNNAGISQAMHREPLRFYELTEAQWRDVFETNAIGPFLMARLAAPLLVARGWGRIVNVSTSIGTITRPGMTPYGPSKAALEAATAAWAGELAETGVTVNALLPGGAVDLPRISAEVFPDRSKLVKAEVMAAPIRWLMSAAADGVTGQRIVANRWSDGADAAENLRAAAAPVSAYR